MSTNGERYRGYPRYDVEVWGGRLDAPITLRGTSIEKYFESGKIGGKKVIESMSFQDNELGRQNLADYVRKHQYAEIDIYWIQGPRRFKRRVRKSEIFEGRFVKEGVRLR
jgi:hypothetical protein